MHRAIAHGLIFTLGGVLWAGASVLRHALALWLADRGKRLDDLNVRRDVYAYGALAWVQLARGEREATCEAGRRALAHCTRDPKLLFHAGCIARAVGERTEGDRLLAAALALDPRFDGRDADRARTLLETP